MDTGAWQPPVWWRTQEQQLARARELWPGIVLPDPPEEFMPQTASEILLLHVPDDGLFALWRKVTAPDGYEKCHWGVVASLGWEWRLTPGKKEFTAPVWLGFDPEHGKGVRPDSFWGQANLAADEILSALIQFPDWALTWGLESAEDSPPTPNLTGYQIKCRRTYWEDRDWLCVPQLSTWDRDDPTLFLGDFFADTGFQGRSSPVVRQLSQ